MIKLVLSALLFVGLSIAALAQKGSFGTLPMASKPGADLTLGPEITNTPSYNKALEVY